MQVRTVWIIVLAATLLADLWIFNCIITRADRKRTQCLAMLALALLIYTLGYFVELLSSSSGAALTALRIQNFGIQQIAPMFLISSIELFRPDLRRRWQLPLAYVYFLAMFAVTLTNEQHMLYYSSAEMVSAGGYSFLLLEHGPMFYVHYGMYVLCSLVSIYVLISRYTCSPNKIRRQIVYFFSGAFFASVVNLLDILDLFPASMDPTPVAMSLGFLAFCLLQRSYGVMDTIAAARDLAVGGLADAFIVLDRDMDFMYCNDSARALCPELRDFKGCEPVSELPEWVRGILNPDCAQGIAFEREVGGRVLKYRARSHRLFSAEGAFLGFSLIISDITDEQHALEQLRRLALTDPLTGILNRRQIMDISQRELLLAKQYDYPCALIMLDIDHFKSINDNYGHSAGDEVLCSISNAVRSRLRDHDAFGRVGGEEFLIFTKSGGTQSLLALAERLRATLEEDLVVFEGREIRYTASFGVVEIPPGGDLEEYLKLADKAMYAAKAGGRNRVEIILDGGGD